MKAPSDAILNLIDPSLREREEASSRVLAEAADAQNSLVTKR